MEYKSFKLNTIEKATLTIAVKNTEFSAFSLCSLLTKVYSKLTRTGISRAIKYLIKGNYLKEIPKNPFFSNRSSYLITPEGIEFYNYYLKFENKIIKLISQ